MSEFRFDLPAVMPGQPLWVYLRTAVRVGPFGPNAVTIFDANGRVTLTPSEAEAIQAAVLKWLEARADDSGIREIVQSAISDASYVSRHYAETDAALAAFLGSVES